MLIECPECKHKVSEEHCFVCPDCNHRIKVPTTEDKAQRHIIAEGETCKDLHEKTEEFLLTEIHEESLDRTRLPSETVSRTMARFAALLVILSKKADKAHNQNMSMQRVITGLTIALFLLTCALLYIGWVQLRIPRTLPQPINLKSNENKKIDSQKSQDTKKDLEVKSTNHHNK